MGELHRVDAARPESSHEHGQCGRRRSFLNLLLDKLAASQLALVAVPADAKRPAPRFLTTIAQYEIVDRGRLGNLFTRRQPQSNSTARPQGHAHDRQHALISLAVSAG